MTWGFLLEFTLILSIISTAVLWKPPPWRHVEDRAWGIDDYGGCRVRGGSGGGNGSGGYGLDGGEQS